MSTKRNALPLYRQVIHEAWRLSITHKHLWLFGFFATFIGFGGASEILLGAYDRITDAVPLATGVAQSPLTLLPGFTTLHAMATGLSPTSAILSIVLFVIMAVLLLAAFAYIIALSIGALVYSIRKVERGGEPAFSEAVKEGNKAVGRVLIINVGAKIAVWLSFTLTGLTLIGLLSNKNFFTIFFFLCSFVLFTILALALSLVSAYATNSTVIEKMPVIPSLADGLRILKKNWLISLEMAIILLVINVGIAVLALFSALIVSVPLVFMFFVAALVKSAALMTAVMSITMIVLLAILFVAMSFLTTFQASAWTLLWIRLSGREGCLPKITRLVDWFQKKVVQ